MTKTFEQILRNPPLLKNPNIGGIDYPTWLSQLREAIEEIIPQERPMTGKNLECLCDSAIGGTFCKCDFSENDGFNQALEQINQALDKEMGNEISL